MFVLERLLCNGGQVLGGYRTDTLVCGKDADGSGGRRGVFVSGQGNVEPVFDFPGVVIGNAASTGNAQSNAVGSAGTGSADVGFVERQADLFFDFSGNEADF